MTARVIPQYQLTAIGLTASEVQQLDTLSKQHFGRAWDLSKDSPLSDKEKALVRKFKAKVKEHLYHAGQGGFCCYCGYTLDDHQGAYDAEHCISKDERAALVFSTRNLALSCKPCNTSKGKVRIRVFPLNDDVDDVSIGTDKYRVVNPHFDKWANHLAIDKYKRVVTADGEGLTKGGLTIKLFNIHRKNAMALANHFDVFRADVKEREDWIYFYVRAMGEDDSQKKTKYKSFLNKLLAMPSDPAADKLREILAPVLA
ncbi:MAG: hypothetical protein IV101_21305 [Dechloromonas sp.]|nr:hypothetical protein [Dechloromonas sp.]